MNAKTDFWLRLLKSQNWIRLFSTLMANNWFTRQFTKGIPCIGFNCYACPLAAVACPIGSIQHFVGLGRVPWYVLGVVGLVGALSGRLACGWLCPFGWFQELLYKLSTPKWLVRPRKRARWWLILATTTVYAAGLLLMLPLATASAVFFALYLIVGLALYAYLGLSRPFVLVGIVLVVAWITHEPWFCKICPAGMLEGGIPQVLLDDELWSLIGSLYWLKFAILAFFVAWMVVTVRPFCRWICPLGALWSLFNRWSSLQMAVEQDECIECDRCFQICPAVIRVYHDANAGHCIRCMRCIKVCPVSCIKVETR